MKKKFYRPLLAYFLLGVRRFFLFFPYRVGFGFGAFIGKMCFYLLGKERKKMLSHLRFAFGQEKSDAEITAIVKNVFTHYGKMVAELALLDKLIPRFDDYVSYEGYEHLDAGLRAGKGVIITTAHFGNWEIMGGYSTLKHGYPLTVIAKRIYYEKYDRLLVSTRNKMNVKTIYRDDSVKAMLGVLRKNGILGFVVDQDVDAVDGVFVNFFNRPAYTPVAPVRFAMASGAPIIPAFVVRKGMKHHIIVEAPIKLRLTGNKEEDLKVNTQAWVSIQEQYIRRYPDQWVWNHRRWKTQTAGTAGAGKAS
jgi:KDO2-lipid IV(A) lauroyltransferase